jgi:hypothetical protein
VYPQHAILRYSLQCIHSTPSSGTVYSVSTARYPQVQSTVYPQHAILRYSLQCIQSTLSSGTVYSVSTALLLLTSWVPPSLSYLRFRKVNNELMMNIHGYYKYLWNSGQSNTHQNMFNEVANTHCTHTLCTVLIRYALYSYTMHCTHTLCTLLIHYALYSYAIYCTPTRCTVLIHYALYSYAMHCTHTLCTVLIHYALYLH